MTLPPREFPPGRASAPGVPHAFIPAHRGDRGRRVRLVVIRRASGELDDLGFVPCRALLPLLVEAPDGRMLRPPVPFEKSVAGYQIWDAARGGFRIATYGLYAEIERDRYDQPLRVAADEGEVWHFDQSARDELAREEITRRAERPPEPPTA